MFTIDQYNALAAAIASGALRVKYADKEVEYRSLAEMVTLLNTMAIQLGLNKPNTGTTIACYDSGL